ncbi:MAG: hypothetical protein ACYDH5_16950 [Acidimicrobiales bacterium]
MADTLAEVRRLLLGSPEHRDAAEEVVAYLAMRSTREDNVERMAGAPKLVDTEAVSQSHAARFHRQVFNEVEVADAQEVADLLGPARDTRGFTQRLRRSSQVIALKHANTFVYPRFQFDFERHTVRPVVAQVNQRLRASTDPWGALAWWLAEQPRWDRRRPVDHLDDASLVDLVEADADDGF